MSSTHTCERCGYQTQSSTKYANHLARKKPCVRRALPEPITSPLGTPTQSQVQPPPVVEHIDDRPTVQDVPTTHVRDFGDETITHVTDHVVGLLFLELDIPALAEYLHFDSDHPENRNVEYVDEESGYICRNGQWTCATMDDICRKIMMRCHGIFTRYYRTYYESIIEHDMSDKEFNYYIDLLDAVQRGDPIVCREFAHNIWKCLRRLRRIATIPKETTEPKKKKVVKKLNL